MKKILCVIGILFMMMVGCVETIPKGNPDRFPSAFFTVCPEGYTTEFTKGYCDDGDCPTECVKEKYYYEDEEYETKE